MKKPDSQKLSLVFFICSLVFFAFLYGLAAGLMHLPPARLAVQMKDKIEALAKYWENDVGLVPTRHLVDGYPDRRDGFTVYRPDDTGDGLILIAGLTPRREALNSAVLFDSSGHELHVWPVDYADLDPDGRAPQNVFLHGLSILRDGSLIVNFDDGNALARLDACGDVIWKRLGKFHHVVTMAGDDHFWTLRGRRIVQVDARTGEILKRISVEKDLFPRAPGILGVLTKETEDDSVAFYDDPFHTNHVEALTAALVPAFPMFGEGDLLVSMRNLNLVMVLDPETLRIKWSKTGPWHRQHNPHFGPDGTIVVYDNNMNFENSRILAVDPSTNEVTVLFEGREDAPFYSWRRGKVQRLQDGRLLVTETEKGRVFMVNRQGELIFEYNNVYDETRNGVLNKAIHLPRGYFDKAALECQAAE